jgi:hypothetical protein
MEIEEQLLALVEGRWFPLHEDVDARQTLLPIEDEPVRLRVLSNSVAPDLGRGRSLPNKKGSRRVAPVETVEEAPDVGAAPHIPALELREDQGTVLDVFDEFSNRSLSGHPSPSLPR